jgi:uncharacterized protein YndB with AHSA1/START domain
VAETPAGTSVVQHEIRVEAPPETVFEFFTDPAKVVRWMGTDATLDPRPGGICRIGMSRDIGASAISGEFVEVAPPSRVVFTWGWESELFGVPPASTLVEVSLMPDGTGTRLRISHRELPPDAIGFHELGWAHYAGRLKEAAEGRDPGPDEWVGPDGVGPGGAR